MNADCLVVTTILRRTSAVKGDEDLRALWDYILDRQKTLNLQFNEDTSGLMSISACFVPRPVTFGVKEPSL